MICVRKTEEKRASQLRIGLASQLSPRVWPICRILAGLNARFSQILAMFNQGDVFLVERCSTGL